MSLDDRIQHWLLLCLRLSVAGALALSLVYQEWGALAYSVLALVLMFLPELISSRAKINLPIEFSVVLVVFMYAAVFLGKVGRAYEHFWWWDGALHTSAGFILGYVAFLVLYINVLDGKIQTTRLFFALTIFCYALAFGAVWEIFEFGMDNLLGGNLQRGSLHDTMWDLIVDSIGALVMSRIGIGIIYDKSEGFITRMTKKFIQANPELKRRIHD
jgi:signal transduction histidine kinase